CIADASDNELRLPARYGQNERAIATSRKVWLFSDTVAGAKASAVIYSLVLTCRACNVEPYAYLRHVLTQLPQRAPETDISDLLPWSFLQVSSYVG
ncbi:transposase domain-containing protein, partial [Caballeronia humi]|uniref:transposase domain-containing protein n=1 Tax=Caballeronia humi TaxID=326474 RepID=UPI0011782EB3